MHPDPLSATPVPTSDRSVSARTFSFAIGLAQLAGGLAAAAAGTYSLQQAWPWWAFLAALPVAYLGTEITARTPSWSGSAVGHLLTMGSLGVVCAPVLGGPSLAWARSGFALVLLGIGGLTVLRAVAAGALPRAATFVLGAGCGLAGGFALWHYGGAVATAWGPAPELWSILLAVAALAYIDHWWTAALTRPRTLDAAMDTACALYLDPVARALAFFDRALPAPRH